MNADTFFVLLLVLNFVFVILVLKGQRDFTKKMEQDRVEFTRQLLKKSDD